MFSLRFGTGLLAAAATLFSVSGFSPAQTLSPIYNFTAPTGSLPTGSLMQADDGNFYGVTQTGGANNFGSIFQLTPAGVESVIYSFTGAAGEYPVGGLIENLDGLLYGVTAGGPDGPGTVFSISMSGTFNTVATLTSAIGAQNPATALIAASDGTLYGATKFSTSASAGGAIFKVSLATGTVSIVYSFAEVGKSIQPSALVMASDGLLYGTTAAGGASDAGTVFRVATDGTSFKVLHSFTGLLGDGSPTGGLVEAADGLLYGVSSGATLALNSLYDVATSNGAFKIIQSDLSLGTVNGLLMGADGKLYGISGGLAGVLPSIFNLTTGGGLTKIVNLSNPLSQTVNLGILSLGLDGNLYGLSPSGGLSGLGFAFKIAESSPLTPPISLSLSEPTITLGNTVSLIYQLENGFSMTATNCSMHGSGASGAVPAAGTQTVTPQATGSLIYAIICDGVEAATASLNVAKASSTTETQQGPGTVQSGANASFTVQVNGNSVEPKPTGTVTLMNGTTTVASGQLDSNGQVTLTFATTNYKPGNYTITENYSGDALYKSSSASYQLTIAADNTSTTVAISSSVIAGKPATVTAKVVRTGAGGQPTGTISFMFQNMVIGTAKVNNVGDASLTTSTADISAGTYPIWASYSGDTYDLSSASSSGNEVITKSSSTSKLGQSTPNVNQGATVTLTSNVVRSVPNEAPAGTVNFYTGSTMIGSATLVNGTATLQYNTTNVPKGSYTVYTTWAGDTISTSSTSNSETFKVN